MGTPAPRPQFARRDFLFGSVGGLTAGAAAWYAAPAGWHEARLPAGTHLSYAQNGEDLVVESLFRLLEVDRPTYVDVGAFDPIICNNTYFFYRKGGRGVLVEPNVALGPTLRRERPRDVVLTAGVGIDAATEADYYLTSAPQMNTFDKATADRLAAETGGKVTVVGVVKMPLMTLNAVIAEHLGAAPDYLSIDVEGLDVPILKTLDFARFRPAVVCAEHSNAPDGVGELRELMAANGYAVRGLTYPNTIFVDKKRMP